LTVDRAGIAVLLAALPLGAAFWLVSRVRRERPLPFGAPAALGAFGAAAAVVTLLIERAVMRFGDLSIESSRSTALPALVTMFVLVVPLEEAAKVVVVWPALWKRLIDGPGMGVTLAACVAAGFAAVEVAAYVSTGDGVALRSVRALVAFPAHLFCTGIWGYALGNRAQKRTRVLPAWLVAVTVRALYDHIVFGRGPGMLAVAFPMLIAMGLVGAGALRGVVPAVKDDWRRLPGHLPEPPSLRAMRRVLQRTDRPLKLRWIVFGAFVNVGAVLLCIALAVFLAHRAGIDLGTADEADMRSNGPLVFLGTALLAAFPLSGFLVARASGTHSVLEPAFASGLAIAAAVFALSVTAPSAVIVSLAVAPFAFGLACGGAWLGVEE